jgi:hypothetical protein
VKKASPLIIAIIGFIIASTFHFIAIAANDAPHNASNNMSCGSCHGEGILNSPFWGSSGIYSTYDELCLSWHKETSDDFIDTNTPFERTYSQLIIRLTKKKKIGPDKDY